jgi:hypothetical protein
LPALGRPSARPSATGAAQEQQRERHRQAVGEGGEDPTDARRDVREHHRVDQANAARYPRRAGSRPSSPAQKVSGSGGGSKRHSQARAVLTISPPASSTEQCRQFDQCRAKAPARAPPALAAGGPQGATAKITTPVARVLIHQHN